MAIAGKGTNPSSLRSDNPVAHQPHSSCPDSAFDEHRPNLPDQITSSQARRLIRPYKKTWPGLPANTRPAVRYRLGLCADDDRTEGWQRKISNAFSANESPTMAHESLLLPPIRAATSRHESTVLARADWLMPRSRTLRDQSLGSWGKTGISVHLLKNELGPSDMKSKEKRAL